MNVTFPQADSTLATPYPPTVIDTYDQDHLAVSFSAQVDPYVLPSKRGKPNLREFDSKTKPDMKEAAQLNARPNPKKASAKMVMIFAHSVSRPAENTVDATGMPCQHRWLKPSTL